MTHCWSEGELRAYIDGELPPRDIDRAAEHLKECAICSGLHAELAQRAGRVAIWMEMLPEPKPVTAMPVLVVRSPSRWRWAAAAAALAASITIGLVMAPKRAPEKLVVAAPQNVVPKAVAPQLPPVSSPPPVQVKPAIIRRVPRKGAAPIKPKPRIETYVALDDEPIETGIVVRVGLNGGQVPADVIVGPDGRARAIRLVDFSGEVK